MISLLEIGIQFDNATGEPLRTVSQSLMLIHHALLRSPVLSLKRDLIRQRLFEIGDDIVRVFQPHGEA